MSEGQFPKPLQAELQPAWNHYVDFLAPYRPALHRYCVRLTGTSGTGKISSKFQALLASQSEGKKSGHSR